MARIIVGEFSMRISQPRSQHLAIALLLTLLTLYLAPALAATCSAMPRSAKYYGRLSDGRKFGVTLIESKTDFAAVQGRLYIGPLYRDIAVEGNVVYATILTLRDADGRAVLEGRFLDDFESLHNLTCDALSIKLADGGEGAMRMSVFNFARTALKNQDAINAVLLDVHDAIETDDAERLAKHVRFPLTIVYPGTKPFRSVVIADAKDFVRQGRTIIGPDLKRDVQRDVPHDPFCRGDDCALGPGRLWFDKDLKITSLIPG
jgi:hypothetical protein